MTPPSLTYSKQVKREEQAVPPLVLEAYQLEPEPQKEPRKRRGGRSTNLPSKLEGVSLDPTKVDQPIYGQIEGTELSQRCLSWHPSQQRITGHNFTKLIWKSMVPRRICGFVKQAWWERSTLWIGCRGKIFLQLSLLKSVQCALMTSRWCHTDSFIGRFSVLYGIYACIGKYFQGNTSLQPNGMQLTPARRRGSYVQQ